MINRTEALEEIRKIIDAYNHNGRGNGDEMDWLAAAEDALEDIEHILDDEEFGE